MKISLYAFKFNINFVISFNTGKNIINKKEGVLLRLTERNGSTGISEISLLPDFTQGNILSATEELKRLKNHFKKDDFPEKISDLFLYTKNLSGELNLSSQVAFALDSALLEIHEKTKSEQAFNLLNYYKKEYSTPPCIKVNTLIVPDEDPEKTLITLRKIVSAGFDTIKIKTGRMKLEKENRLLKLISDKYKERLRIRTDSNMKMCFAEAKELFRGVNPQMVEYAEDPFTDFKNIPRFFSETGIKTGVDLTDKNIDLKKIISMEGLGSIIIKPALAGGIHNIENIFNLCKEKDIPLIFSSLFETGIGIINIAKVSTLFDYKKSPMGLDTLKYLKKSPLTNFNMVKNGILCPYKSEFLNLTEKIFTQNSLERIM